MAIKLNSQGYDYAKRLIENNQLVLDEPSDWNAHRPTQQEETIYMQLHGPREYSRWYLGVDDGRPETDPAHYLFPIGDYEKAHRCELVIAEQSADKHHLAEIKQAAASLRGLLEA